MTNLHEQVIGHLHQTTYNNNVSQGHHVIVSNSLQKTIEYLSI
jgi:hypothetical protein